MDVGVWDFIMHIPVLLNEVIRTLQPKEGEIFIDGTLGGGGHAEAILKLLGKKGMFVGIDADAGAIDEARKKFKNDARCTFIHGNYADIPEILNTLHIDGADGMLIDLGFSSTQIDDPTRGFSFKFSDAILDMRYGVSGGEETAYAIVNAWDEKSLLSIFKKFGEERYAGRVARKIVEERRKKKIRTVGDLVGIIERTIPMERKKRTFIHPATRIFQALRIAVNHEFENLSTILDALPSVMRSGGRTGIISFHSLEDREVKVHFKSLVACGVASFITKKPIIPSVSESSENPRSRSAKLRALLFS